MRRWRRVWGAQGRLCAEDKGDSSLFKRARVCECERDTGVFVRHRYVLGRRTSKVFLFVFFFF